MLYLLSVTAFDDGMPGPAGGAWSFQPVSPGILSFWGISRQNSTQSQKAALFTDASQLPRYLKIVSQVESKDLSNQIPCKSTSSYI